MEIIEIIEAVEQAITFLVGLRDSLKGSSPAPSTPSVPPVPDSSN